MNSSYTAGNLDVLKRLVLNLSTAVSLLALAAATAAWIASTSARPTWKIRTTRAVYALQPRGSAIVGKIMSRRPPVAPAPDDGALHCRLPRGESLVLHNVDLSRDTVWQRMGFGFAGLSESDDADFFSDLDQIDSFRIVSVPTWLLCTVLALLPLYRGRAALKARRLHSRRESGLCPWCGYDLRATPTHCPECGGGALGRPAAV